VARGAATAPASPSPQATPSAAAAAHEKGGAAAADKVRGLIDAKDYQRAADLARLAGQEYSDTAAAGDLKDLLVAAESGLAAANKVRDDAEKAKKLEREQDAGTALSAIKALISLRDYAAAVTQGQRALKDFADTSRAKEIEEALADAQQKADAEREVRLAARRLREQDAARELADIETLLDNKDYDKAVEKAAAAAREYADTSQAKNLADILAAARVLQETAQTP